MLLFFCIYKELPFIKTDEKFSFKEMYKRKKIFNFKENLYCFDNNLNTILKECLKIDYKDRI